jgi:hypothetical protein
VRQGRVTIQRPKCYRFVTFYLISSIGFPKLASACALASGQMTGIKQFTPGTRAQAK